MKKSTSFAKSLSAKIILATSILLALVVIIIASFETILVYGKCKNNLNIQSSMVVQHIENELQIVEKLADNTVNTINLISPNNVEQLLNQLLNSNENIKDASILFGVEKTKQTGLIIPTAFKDGETGQIYYRYAPNDTVLKRYKDQPSLYVNSYEVADIVAHHTEWVGPYRDINGLLEFSYMTTSDAEYPETDILEVAITLDKLLSILKEIKPYKNTEIFILDEQYDILFSTSKSTTLPKNDGYALNLLNLRADDKSFDKYKNKNQFYVNYEDRCIICRKVMNNGWALVVKCYLEDVFADVLVLLGNMAVLMLVSLILLFYFSVKIIFEKSRSLVEFAKVSESIAHGNFETKLPVISEKNEISQLRDAFANMQVSLKKYMSNLAEATARSQKMESELSIAADIQTQVLRTEFPSDEKFDLYALMRPAKEVGGDLYDFVKKGDKLYFCVGDVSGKGVPASLMMMITTMLFRYISTSTDMELNEMASTINDRLADGNNAGFFVTLFLACINLNTYEMEFCNCGHNRILIVDADGKARFNDAISNIAIGLFEGFNFVGEKVKLESNSRVILYTDGVNEAENDAVEEFGNDRLIEWANSTTNYVDENSLVEGLFSNVKSFTNGALQNDDITILSVKLN